MRRSCSFILPGLPSFEPCSDEHAGLGFLFIQARLRKDAACEVNNMSTRGCIARLQRKNPLEFKGVYHHWDGYPSGLGQALFLLRNTEFGGDTEAMLKTLIDDHPAGWSTVVGATFSKSPGFRARGAKSTDADDDAPQCYCHGTRSEPGWIVTQRNAAGSGIEFAYAFDGDTMLVLGSYVADGEKMIGMFGCGDGNAVWRVIAEVNLDGSAPDWEMLDEGGSLTAQPVSSSEDGLCNKTQPAR